jgi:hypothetical protein
MLFFKFIPFSCLFNSDSNLKFSEMRLAEMSSMGIGNKPCLDIRPSADQISDRSISIAQLSKSKFPYCLDNQQRKTHLQETSVPENPMVHFSNTVETGYTAGIWGHHEHPRYKLTVL